MKLPLLIGAVIAIAAAPLAAGDVSFSVAVGGRYGGHHQRHHGHGRHHYGHYSRGWYGPSIYTYFGPSVYYHTYRTEPTIIYSPTVVVPRYTVESYSSLPNPSRVIYAEPSRVYSGSSTVYTPAPTEPVIVERRPLDAAPTASTDGWTLLAQGDDRGAQAQFARAVAADPASDVTKVGFALASASQGNLDQSVWAMRRALANDASVLTRVMIGDDLRRRLSATADRFIFASPDQGVSKADASFMVAAIHTILDDKAAAGEWLDKATTAGDNSAAARNLRALLAR